MAYRRLYPPLYSAAADAGADRCGDTVHENHFALRGWALINPADMVGQNLWVSFMQLLPYVLQSGILILFAVLLLGFRGILDRADGLPAAADRARQVQYLSLDRR